ncbi:hypothetical protein [Microbispora sp. NBRC 16548]|uniref:hypothetical protein n=1 Tax=Microbispora sp. NBRC 16548 TaxID=3030994 RepID=UPI0024A32E35|nr:hypothetical protein [Microbispora sp. NBRC 16548]GLX06717.1 hypothetical protein Misp03_36440 [Microbispora sp. NBRC 16548]
MNRHQPALGQRLAARRGWIYSAPGMPVGRGAADITVWVATYPGGETGVAALVSDCDNGPTVINGIEYIEPAVRAEFDAPNQPVTLIEHTSDGFLDEAWIGSDGRACWRRIWPTTEVNPDHAQLDAWAEVNAAALHAAGVTALLEGMAKL